MVLGLYNENEIWISLSPDGSVYCVRDHFWRIIPEYNLLGEPAKEEKPMPIRRKPNEPNKKEDKKSKPDFRGSFIESDLDMLYWPRLSPRGIIDLYLFRF